MKTVREMFVSLTTMLINHIWASIIEICVEKWRTQSLKKFEIQMSRHEKRYRSEEMSPVAHSCTIFPCYLGMEIWPPGWSIQSTPPHRRSPLPTRQSMQRPNEKQQRLSSWAINYLHMLGSHQSSLLNRSQSVSE